METPSGACKTAAHDVIDLCWFLIVSPTISKPRTRCPIPPFFSRSKSGPCSSVVSAGNIFREFSVATSPSELRSHSVRLCFCNIWANGIRVCSFLERPIRTLFLSRESGRSADRPPSCLTLALRFVVKLINNLSHSPIHFATTCQRRSDSPSTSSTLGWVYHVTNTNHDQQRIGTTICVSDDLRLRALADPHGERSAVV